MRSLSYTALGLLLLSAVLSPALGQWQQINGRLKHVTASINYVWGVNSANKIYKCVQPCNGAWTLVAGLLKQIDAGDEEVWGVNANDYIYKRPVDGSGNGWQLIPGRLKHVSASGNGYIWGVNSNDQIYTVKEELS